jgi:DNA-binding beta-propeller fold protein YncE
MQKTIHIKHLGLLILVSLSVLWMSCDKVPETRPIDIPGDSLSTGMLIGSEGNFQWGNATLSFWDQSSNKLYEDIYKTVNQKPLGDVLQSITVWKDQIFLVLNNSGKISVINKHNFKETASISGLQSPRYVLPVSENKAYVSDLYAQNISIINLENYQVSGKIACAGWTEEMIMSANKVFVCNKYSEYLYVINPATDVITDSIPIGYGSISIVEDKHHKLWVLTTGNTSSNPKIEASILCIDPNNLAILKTFKLGNDKLPLKLCINKNKEQLYWIEQHIWSMSIADTSLPVQALIQANGRIFYGLGYDAQGQQLWASDAKDYVQKSEVLVYDEKGTFIKSLRAGINTSSFSSK